MSGERQAKASKSVPVTIRVVIAEDQGMVRGALAALLGLEPDFDVVGTAEDGQQAYDLVQELQPDLLLADIEMPRMSGIELAAKVADLDPAPRVVMLTTFGRSGYFQSAVAAGAVGYMLKDAPAEHLAAALRRVKAGGRAFDPELAAMPAQANPLTTREREVLRLVGDGCGNAEIASRVHLSRGTVRNYISEAMSKLHARNRTAAARIARDKGWL